MLQCDDDDVGISNPRIICDDDVDDVGISNPRIICDDDVDDVGVSNPRIICDDDDSGADGGTRMMCVLQCTGEVWSYDPIY